MIRNCCLIFLIALPLIGWSQTYIDTHDPKSSEVKSLFGKGNELDGFGGGDFRVSTIKEDMTLLTGLYGGMIVNRNYLLGIGAYGIVTENDFKDTYPGGTEQKKLNLHGGYGGLLVGATILTKEIVHFSIPILIGGGSVDVVDKKFLGNFNGSEVTIEKSAFFVCEPALQLEVNVTRRFRIAAGAAYRYVAASGFKTLTDADLAGFSSSLSFRFGRY